MRTANVASGTTEQVAIVTGASAGIGLYTVLGLAKAGMRVVMTGRHPARTEAARRFVVEHARGVQIETAIADFASLAEVRRLADELLARHRQIDLLVNNAGLFSPKFARSTDGYELTFAVNHLAPFLLTNLLLERLKASVPARIVTVASRAHHGNQIDLETIAGPRNWSMIKAYGRSKLCNILFTRELARQLDGTGVVAVSLHPGVVATRLAQRGGLVGLAWGLMKPFMISPERGAQTSLFLATVPDPARFHGGYVVGRALAAPDRAAFDDSLARRLWAESARLVGLPEAAPGQS
jgi:NAD(P)-dependent dehydrogenase (short-subunit alcohol dehydrogenase family)